MRRRTHWGRVSSQLSILGCVLLLLAACGFADASDPTHTGAGAIGEPADATATYAQPAHDVTATPGSATPTPTVDATSTPVVDIDDEEVATAIPTFPGEEPPPTPPSELPGRPDPDSPLQLGMDTSYEAAADFDFVPGSRIIATGTVVELLPARWTTPDATRPANPHDPTQVPLTYTIVTPIRIELDQQFFLTRGVDVPAEGILLIAAEGGQVGEDLIESERPWDQFAVGERVMVAVRGFHVSADSRFGAPLDTDTGAMWSVINTFVLLDDGSAVDYDGNSRPIEDLMHDIEQRNAEVPAPAE